MSVNILTKGSRLPSEYQEVEYIESSGTQYIDTGIKLENNSYCNIDFKYSELQYQLMGGNTETTQRYFIGIKSTLDLFYFGTGDTNNYYGTADTNRHSFIIDMPNSKVAVDDNYSDVSFTFTNNNSSHNFYLFARINSAGQIVNNCAGRLYRGLFKHNNSVIRNFIPCYRKSDSEIGLYDLINGIFYTNAGTGTFLKGDMVVSYELQKMKVNLLKPAQRLPNEYQEVQYIQGSGTQYIDTGIGISSFDIVKSKFEITASTSSMKDAIYGSYAGNFFVLLMRSPSQARVGTSSNQASSTNYELNKIYDTSLANGTYIENGTTYTFTPHTGFTNLPSCYIMSRNQSGAFPVSAKVYSFEIVGKFNGIPCYRKADGVIGLYDTVSETFFTNAGTGTFLKGANVNSGYQIQPVKVNILKKLLPDAYQQVEYIESTGTQYIDTGFSVNSNSCLEIEGYFSYISGQTRDGARIGVKNSAFNFMSIAGDGMRIDYGSQQITDQKKDMLYLKLDGKNNSIDILYADNTQSSISLQQETFSTELNYYLFALNNNGQAQYSSERITACKLNDNGLLVRNFIPCYRKSDGEIGLYDLVNDVFYNNAGTGTFEKGNDVNQYVIIKI